MSLRDSSARHLSLWAPPSQPCFLEEALRPPASPLPPPAQTLPSVTDRQTLWSSFYWASQQFLIVFLLETLSFLPWLPCFPSALICCHRLFHDWCIVVLLRFIFWTLPGHLILRGVRAVVTSKCEISCSAFSSELGTSVPHHFHTASSS